MEAMIDSAASNYIIPSLQLDDGWFIFSSVSKLLSSITPNDMSLIFCILELLRDAVQSKVSILQIILEALKVESGYICLLVIIFLISLIPFCYTIAWCCSRNIKLKAENDMRDIVHSSAHMVLPSDVRVQEERKEKLNKYHCRKRVRVFILQCFTFASLVSILSMFIVNEQIYVSINELPKVIKSALKDAEFFVKSSNHQLQMEVFEQFDRTREKIKIDLEDIDKLLGEQITREISIQTGIDITFETTLDILDKTKELSQRVQFLMNGVLFKTLLLSADAASKVDEIHIQLSVLQRQCNFRDRPLCETLKVKSFEEMGFIGKVQSVNENGILQKLRAMSDEFHDNNLRKLTDELTISKKTYRNYSHQLYQDSTKHLEEVLRQLTIMRNGLNETLNSLSSVVKSALNKIEKIWGSVVSVIEMLIEAAYIGWLIGIVACASTLIVTLFTIIPMSCSCCSGHKYAGGCYLMTSSLLSVFSVLLGLFTIFELLIGGHGEVFICRAMYEKPEYSIIGKLFDNPGIIYSKSSTNGVLPEFLMPSERNAKPFTNVSLSKVLNECERDKSVYEIFQLENLLDLNNVLHYENYLDLTRSIKGIRATESQFIEFTAQIQRIFDDLINNSRGNFTEYRLELVQVSPEKEMINFIDQMQRVSLQIQDVSTVSRMATLTSAAKRIQTSTLQPLEILKNEIIFHLTALEFHINPWMHKIKEIKDSFNQSQKFLNEHSVEICANFSENFRNRLRSNLAIFRNETMQKIHVGIGCGHLFEIYNGVRLLLCRHIIEPINGLFLLSFILLILWTISTPTSLSLASAYDMIENINKQLDSSALQQQSFNVGSTNEFANREVTWSSRPQRSISSQEIDRSNW
ncbi:CLUMA_CG018802, isoform A [Clunio marinus]|uniref:CLUMA_CG018802, isoform A n=1 Tax=Clunio marinus TaxID=568069 RepID=A0A1J1J058_9DIPT|nr:CLUMA_CG018802, isoform A [Clunio marinus]